MNLQIIEINRIYKVILIESCLIVSLEFINIMICSKEEKKQFLNTINELAEIPIYLKNDMVYIYDGNNKDINAEQIISYIVRGAKMRSGDSYPNREWGYGMIDVNRIFNAIRGEYYDSRGINNNEYELGNLFIREPNKLY